MIELIDLPHRAIKTDQARIARLRAKYRAYLAEHGRKPIFYDRSRWTPIPASFEPRNGARARA